jgi:hypothetical protein
VSPSAAPAASSLEQAEATRDALRGKLDDARLSLAALDEARKEYGFEAHTVGGEAAKRLAKMNKDRLAILGDIETLEEAMLEASRRLATEEQRAHRADQAERAERALELAGELSKKAHKLDELLATVAELSNDLRADIRELNHQIGCTYPNEHQLQSLGERAVKAALMFSAFKIEHLAPKDRYKFTQLFNGWTDTIARWASDRLPRAEAAK